MAKEVVIIGYSGHSYVVIDVLKAMGKAVAAYCEKEEKKQNPFNLQYVGDENNAIDSLSDADYFIAIGDNFTRKAIYQNLSAKIQLPINAIHPSAIIASHVEMGTGVLMAANATVNPLAKIGNGAICNTGCIIEHDCELCDFCHIAPGAVLCGDVKIGECSFIGANAVVKQGVKIGNNVIVGSGTVVLNDIQDEKKVAGNPQREI